MFISRASVPRAQQREIHRPIAMSAQEKEVIVVGTVVRRRSEDVVKEMAKIANYERARMTAQASPAPPYPGRFEWSRLHPIRHRKPLNPVPPPSPEETQIAAVKRREFAEGEARILEKARRLANRPRTPTPPRKEDDHYDLARWAFRRGL